MKRLRVLVVEDNIINQELAVQLLRKRGHVSQVASNGREAVRMYQPGAFDLVLMDVQMPEMDGFDATRAIRKREHGSGVRVPILAMTAHVFCEDQQRCQDAGMDGFLAKPIQAADFFAAVEVVAAGAPPTEAFCISSPEFPTERE